MILSGPYYIESSINREVIVSYALFSSNFSFIRSNDICTSYYTNQIMKYLIALFLMSILVLVTLGDNYTPTGTDASVTVSEDGQNANGTPGYDTSSEDNDEFESTEEIYGDQDSGEQDSVGQDSGNQDSGNQDSGDQESGGVPSRRKRNSPGIV